jgi:hypothetical protein
MYIYTYTSQYRKAGRAKGIKTETAVNAACPGNLPTGHFGYACQRFVSPAVGEGSDTIVIDYSQRRG